MNDNLHPDALDDELRRRFAAGAPTDTDPDAVLDAMRPRLQQARTRRRAAIAGAVGAVAAVVLVVLLVLGGGGGGDGAVRVPPASRSQIHTVPAAPTTTAAGGSVTDDTKVSGTNGGGFFNADPTSAPPDTAPTGPSGADPVTTAPTSPTQPAPTDHPYSSAGGSIVVHFENGQVSLVSSSPAAGYTASTQDNGPTRVEVRFSDGSTEWRIRVDVDNGQLVSEITSHG